MKSLPSDECFSDSLAALQALKYDAESSIEGPMLHVLDTWIS